MIYLAPNKSVKIPVSPQTRPRLRIYPGISKRFKDASRQNQVPSRGKFNVGGKKGKEIIKTYSSHSSSCISNCCRRDNNHSCLFGAEHLVGSAGRKVNEGLSPNQQYPPACQVQDRQYIAIRVFRRWTLLPWHVGRFEPER